VAFFSKSATSTSIRQQRKLLWPNKNGGKLIRESLQTTVWIPAKVRLPAVSEIVTLKAENQYARMADRHPAEVAQQKNSPYPRKPKPA
jgi:hypothetical protein